MNFEKTCDYLNLLYWSLQSFDNETGWKLYNEIIIIYYNFFLIYYSGEEVTWFKCKNCRNYLLIVTDFGEKLKIYITTQIRLFIIFKNVNAKIYLTSNIKK